MKHQHGVVDLLFAIWVGVLAHWFHLGYITAEDNTKISQSQTK